MKVPPTLSVDFHTSEEVSAVVEELRPQLNDLISDSVIRPWPNCHENDLHALAYNALIARKYQ